MKDRTKVRDMQATSPYALRWHILKFITDITLRDYVILLKGQVFFYDTIHPVPSFKYLLEIYFRILNKKYYINSNIQINIHLYFTFK